MENIPHEIYQNFRSFSTLEQATLIHRSMYEKTYVFRTRSCDGIQLPVSFILIDPCRLGKNNCLLWKLPRERLSATVITDLDICGHLKASANYRQAVTRTKGFQYYNLVVPIPLFYSGPIILDPPSIEYWFWKKRGSFWIQKYYKTLSTTTIIPDIWSERIR